VNETLRRLYIQRSWNLVCLWTIKRYF